LEPEDTDHLNLIISQSTEVLHIAYHVHLIKSMEQESNSDAKMEIVETKSINLKFLVLNFNTPTVGLTTKAMKQTENSDHNNFLPSKDIKMHNMLMN